MSWNLPLFIIFLFAGPFAYAVLSLIQPDKLTVLLGLAAIPALMFAVWIIRYIAWLFK